MQQKHGLVIIHFLYVFFIGNLRVAPEKIPIWVLTHGLMMPYGIILVQVNPAISPAYV